MCGVNGIINSINLNEKSLGINEIIKSMNRVISHRGPDASGVWANSGIALGHVRLSIMDLSERSNQPMVYDDFVIVFNGEIYNFKSLKEDLAGVVFKTTSDTEVIVEMWRKYGTSCLNKLRGMFVFAIYDKSSAETFIVRDHFGIKPLFYLKTDKCLIFSSELKALESVTECKENLNMDAVASSLAYVWVPEHDCIYSEVTKVQAGSYLKISSELNVEEVSYWNSRNLIAKPADIHNENEAIDLLNSVLQDSVAAHMVSDVPVNAFLSGGLDSSLLVAMAKKHVDQLDCYTIKFRDKDQKNESMTDDSFYAKKVAKELGVTLHTIEVQPNLVELLPKIVHHLDEPIGDSAAINTFIICQAAQDNGVKVLLSGMGADEMFAGYRKHYANSLATIYRKAPRILRSSIESVLSEKKVASDSDGNKIIRWAKRFVSFAGLDANDAFLRSYTYYDLTELADSFDEVDPNIAQLRSNHHELFDYAYEKRGLVDAMCFTDINHFMVGLNLTYSDRASMAASTEIRVPFIDKKVMEAAFRISSSLKLKGSKQKYILKKVAENWLPKEVIYRPKASFSMPLRAWIRNDLSDLVDEYLLSINGLSSRGILKTTFIQKLVDDEFMGKEDNAQKIWHLLTLEQWLRNNQSAVSRSI